MEQKVIDMKNITKVYRIGDIKVNALRGTDLTIREGEFVALMGPSGSGKSTLMNIIGALDIPTSGSYLLEDIDISKLNDNQLAEIRNKKIGFVFQTFNLLSRANVMGNIELPLIYSRKNLKKSRRKMVSDVIESIGLTEWIRHRPNELSGGQKQRVAIGRALVNDPAVILADEPTGNLDSRTGEEILAIFQDLNRQGKTILFVTHELELAKHAQKIVYLRDGMIINEEKIDDPIDARKMLEEMPKLEDKIYDLEESN
ncbi:MAG: ABC transporter ATP-binding protein [Actinomycetota bacterium]|nr:MAG: ABC transporter ATP-binding protein [Actinomycetota bacterium]